MKKDIWKEKYDKLLNERDSILQSVYNEMMYSQPVEYSLKTKLIKHCSERGIEIPVQIQ